MSVLLKVKNARNFHILIKMDAKVVRRQNVSTTVFPGTVKNKVAEIHAINAQRDKSASWLIKLTRTGAKSAQRWNAPRSAEKGKTVESWIAETHAINAQRDKCVNWPIKPTRMVASSAPKWNAPRNAIKVKTAESWIVETHAISAEMDKFASWPIEQTRMVASSAPR